ncbi:MAG: 3'-5' exonuclease, partial [Thermoguttaceae bacterium]|nr:3'-5' exonuclease [Thermoguttaceae bacterium]
MKHLFEGLNKAQEEAIRFKDGPLLVLAGPGSGKTRVVTHRIAWLLEQGVPDWQIVAMTFTNKAANEMNSRLASLAPGARVWMGTFHKFCARLLRMYADKTRLGTNFTIYDTDQSRQLLDNLIDKSSLPNGVDAQKIAGAISWAKNNLILPDDYVARAGSLLGKTVEEVYPQYQQALRECNAVDFDDLLVRVAVMLKENPGLRHDLDARYRYLLLDEYQDTNLVQYAISRALSIDYPNLCVTGDPDQSIYGWRGANINNILDFEKDFPTVRIVRLEQNYRSTKSILAAASSLIKHNKHRKEKDLYTDNTAGVRPRVLTCFNQRDEAEIIAREIATAVSEGRRQPGDFAIFYRTNALSRNLEHALHRNGVPFQLVRGLEFFGRREIRDLVAYFQLIYNTSDSIAFRRIINLPTRGIGRTTIGKLENYAASSGVSLFDAARCVDRIDGITAKTRKSIADFVAMIDRFAEMAADVHADLEVLLSIVLRDSKYLQSIMGDTEEDKQRCANVQELLSEVREFDQELSGQSEEEDDQTTQANLPPGSLFETNDADGITRLGRFLERTALVNDVDAWNNGSERVSLMSLHAAKGLEFPVVYIIAVEENILPHERSLKDAMQLEEERRLLFVGMTRAREELLMSKCVYREFRGMYSVVISSRFLFDISPETVETVDCTEQLPPDFEGRGTTQDVLFL